MTVVRLALTRRWLGIFAMTVAFAVACVVLGQWQFARRAEAQAAIALLNANFDRSSAPIAEVLPEYDNTDRQLKWTPVSLTGRYIVDSVVYVRNRVSEAGIGFEQLVPFVNDDGGILIINRGWVSANEDYSAPANPPTVPQGNMTVTARLMPSEQTIAGRSAPDGQVATINAPDLAAITTFDSVDFYTGWYARLDSESVSADTGIPWDRPILDEGPHLSYALQWYVFALMGFVGYGWALRKEARGDDTTTGSKPRTGRQRDEDVEDAIVDSRLG
ncbi:MAG: SURF1 family protein [Microbacteriaceae bacterium]